MPEEVARIQEEIKSLCVALSKKEGDELDHFYKINKVTALSYKKGAILASGKSDVEIGSGHFVFFHNPD